MIKTDISDWSYTQQNKSTSKRKRQDKTKGQRASEQYDK